MRRAQLAVALVLAAAATAQAAPDDGLGSGAVIYARGDALYRSDAKGKNETQIAQLPPKTTVRALRSDGAGRVLLVDLAGKWSWLPLDGSTKTLADLPCG